MNIKRFYFNFKIGFEALMVNRFRAFLTSLGIIFGVASVISMLAIGKGAEREIMEQIKQVGSNNIIIKPKLKPVSESNQDKNASKSQPHFNPIGLTMGDLANIQQAIPYVLYASPEVQIETSFVSNGKKTNGNLIGITNAYLEVANAGIAEGAQFSDYQLEHALPVCLIGEEVRHRFFPTQNPVGQAIKCGEIWLTVVGVLQSKTIDEKTVQKLAIRNLNSEVYIPLSTALVRFKNRALITARDLKQTENGDEPKPVAGPVNYNQLDRLVISVSKSEYVPTSTEIIGRLLKRKHNGLDDFELIVPEQLLRQEQKTKDVFNAVLGIIASISLLVGGIGIMNIMLASVMERIMEIGLRLSLGATKKDIVMQFVSEAVTISLTGGFVGIFLGVTISLLIEKLTGIQTIISPVSVIASFGISISIGLIFGIYPARKASMQDPVLSLRAL